MCLPLALPLRDVMESPRDVCLAWHIPAQSVQAFVCTRASLSFGEPNLSSKWCFCSSARIRSWTDLVSTFISKANSCFSTTRWFTSSPQGW